MASKKEFFTNKKCRLVCIVELGRMGDKRRRDCFNYEKALTDFCVEQGIIPDDSLIDCGIIHWSGKVEAGAVQITFYQLNEGETFDDYELSIQRKSD